MKLLVAGACGFIGSNFVRLILARRPNVQVIVYDLLTYAGNLENLADLMDDPRMRFVHADICDRAAVTAAADGVDAIVNFAAESHVDRSILDASPFIRTNVAGTQVLLDVAMERKIPRFVQISTDEVYGSLGATGKFVETMPLEPNSPYSASKASADLLVRAYIHTHRTPAVVMRSSNAYGPYQFPEKLIPLMIMNAFEGRHLPVYGDGMQVRDWIHVLDFCEGVLTVLEKGVVGEIYNLGGDGEIPNIEIVKRIIALTGASTDLIRHVPDRPGHDRRYAMDYSKISRELGWAPKWNLEKGLAETVEWYRTNKAWLDNVRSGAYREYYDRQYAARLAAGRAT